MLFNLIVNFFFDKLEDILLIANMWQLEFLELPYGVFDVIISFLRVAVFFIPVSTYPIFLFLFGYMAAKILIRIVDTFFTTLRLVPIISKILY